MAKARNQLSIPGVEVAQSKPWRANKPRRNLPIAAQRTRVVAEELPEDAIERWRARSQNPPMVSRTAFEVGTPCCGNCNAFATTERVFEDVTGICARKQGEWSALALFDRHTCDDHAFGIAVRYDDVAELTPFQMTLSDDCCATCAAFIALKNTPQFGVCAEFRSPWDGRLTMRGNACLAHKKADM